MVDREEELLNSKQVAVILDMSPHTVNEFARKNILPAFKKGKPPAGEAYFPVEGANGELGFYVVSDGTDRPYRVRCRPPCLPPVAAMPRMIEGQMVADIIPTVGSVNMIGGELDR